MKQGPREKSSHFHRNTKLKGHPSDPSPFVSQTLSFVSSGVAICDSANHAPIPLDSLPSLPSLRLLCFTLFLPSSSFQTSFIPLPHYHRPRKSSSIFFYTSRVDHPPSLKSLWKHCHRRAYGRLSWVIPNPQIPHHRRGDRKHCSVPAHGTTPLGSGHFGSLFWNSLYPPPPRPCCLMTSCVLPPGPHKSLNISCGLPFPKSTSPASPPQQKIS